MQQPVIFLTFANDKSQPSRELQALTLERVGLVDALHRFEQGNRGKVFQCPSSDPLVIIDHVQKLSGNIIVFHYAGHADGQQLYLETLAGDTVRFQKNNLVEILQQERGIRLVFLNACATIGHLEILQEIGIPAVILTDGSIADKTAKDFSISFYQALTNGFSLKDAFVQAYQNIEKVDKEPIYRGIDFGKIEEENPKWGLYVNHPKIEEWKLESAFTHRKLNEITLFEKNQFVGREKELRQIKSGFQQHPIVSINGLGGIGKTTLAQAFLNRYKDSYDHVAWFSVASDVNEDANIRNTILNVISRDKVLFDNLKIEYEQDLGDEERFASAVNAMSQLHGKKLMVLDNVDEDFRNIKNRLPTEEGWQILITSRHHFASVFEIPLEKLSEPEALKLFYLHHPGSKTKENKQDIEEFLAAIDRHTLMVELFAKLLAENSSMTIKRIRDQLANRKTETLPFAIHTQYSKESLTIFEYILSLFDWGEGRFNEEEKFILSNFSVLPNIEIGVQTLFSLLKIDLYAESQRMKIEEALSRLISQGWIEQNRLSLKLSCHQYIQEVMRYRLQPTIETCADLIDSLTRKLNLSPQFKEINLEMSMKIAANVLDLIGNNEARAGQLWANYGGQLQMFGDFKESAHVLNQAIRIAEKSNQVELLAEAQSGLGNVYYNLGELRQSQELYKRVLGYYRESGQKKSPKSAIVYNNLANVFYREKNYEKAKKYMQKAIEIDIKYFGKNSTTIAIRKANLSGYYFDTGDYKKAEELLLDAIRIDQKENGEEDIWLAVRRGNLANILREQGRLDEALEHALFAKELNAKIQGDEHLWMGYRYLDLGRVYLVRKEYSLAAKYLEKSYKIRLKELGEYYEETIESKQYLDEARQHLKA